MPRFHITVFVCKVGMKAHTTYYPRAKFYVEITWIDQCIGLEVNPNEYSKQAGFVFHDDTSVLKRGPMVVAGRPMQIYFASWL